MKGKFRQDILKYFFSAIFMFAGSFVAVRFALWGMDELFAARLSSAVFCFAFALGGILFGFLSIFIFCFNRAAELDVENGKLKARFGWGRELCTDISEIRNAEVHGKHLKLFFCDRIVWIYNLGNAKDVCEHILSQIPKNGNFPDARAAERICKKSKRAYAFYLALTTVACAFLFIHVGWCAFLTEGKSLIDFSVSDDIVFLAFAFAEIFTVLSAFFFARKCGKRLEMLNMSKRYIATAAATQHKNDGIDKYPNVINKKFFSDYSYRIIVFAPKEDVFAYMLEKFDIKTLSWEFCYGSARGFELLSELYEAIEASFEDVMLVD